jgi:hypothetical protein
MKEKIVYQLNSEGYFIKEVILSEVFGDYKEDGWLIPARCVEIEPLPEKEGNLCRWDGSEWEYVEIPPPQEETKPDEIATPEVLMTRLDNELQLQMGELNQAFVASQIRKDAALQNELRKELEEIEAWYQEMQEKIEQGENPWEGE